MFNGPHIRHVDVLYTDRVQYGRFTPSFIVPPPTKVVYVFSFHVTVHRTKFLYNKTK